MIFFSRQDCKCFLAGTLIIAYLVNCFLALWFHHHPGEDHDAVKGDFYHSHASAFTSPTPESEEDHHELLVSTSLDRLEGDNAGLHSFTGNKLLDEMQASIEAYFDQVIAFGKFAPRPDFVCLPAVTISPPVFVIKTTPKFPSVPPGQDYFVLMAAGLSPPLV